MRVVLGFSVLVLSASPVMAAETTTYSYDALGRLVKVSHNGATNTGASATYQFDPADNRSTVTAPRRVVVVPLNGYTIIPVPNP